MVSEQVKLVNIGEHFFFRDVFKVSGFFASKSMADVLLEQLESLLFVSRLKGRFYNTEHSYKYWDSKSEFRVAFYNDKIVDKYGEVEGKDFLFDLSLYFDKSYVCDTIRLIAEDKDFLGYDFKLNKSDKLFGTCSYVLIQNENDLQLTFDFMQSKI